MQEYPRAPRGDGVETIAGLSFPDPYSALEDAGDPAVAAWEHAQAELADASVAAIDGVERLQRLVARYMEGDTNPFEPPEVPRWAGGRWFRREHAAAATQADVVVSESLLGEGRVVFRPTDHPDEEGRVPFVSWASPAPNGELLAVGVCYDGSEANTIRLVDVASGRLLADRPPRLLMDNYTDGAQWLADSSGFFYVALDGPKDTFRLRIFRHDVGQPPRHDPEEVPWPAPPVAYVGVFVARDGRWAVACDEITAPRPVAVLDLTRPDAEWRSFSVGVDTLVAGHLLGDDYVAITDHEAPRGRVVAIPLAAAAHSGPETWRVLVPESSAVLRSLTVVGERLYLAELVDTYARIRVLDRAGREIEQVPLPSQGSLAEPFTPMLTFGPRGHPEEYLFNFSSLTESWGLYRHRPGADAVETITEPDLRLDAVVEDRWATSADGTQIPYHLVRPREGAPVGPLPTLISAYGGFNTAWLPLFPGAAAAFVAAGGVLVHAHLRGGSEFGRDWWEAGRLGNKLKTFDDLYGIAEDLIAAGVTTPEQLAVTGHSNGGLLAAVAVTQRPDLWGAAVPQMPIADLLGGCREAYAAMAIRLDFADPDDPDGVVHLTTFSPYHLVEDGTAYPAVYVVAGATDPRCSPWHARKLVARLQEATTSSRPILLRVWDNTGHGSATAKDVDVAQHTAWLAFLFDQLGLRVP